MELEGRLIENQKQFKKLAFEDGLTSLRNRRGFFRIAENLVKKTEKFSLLYLDLNKFKEINDTLGHFYEDEVLIEFSRRL